MTDIAVEKSFAMLMDNMDKFSNFLPNLGFEIGGSAIASGVIATVALLSAVDNYYNEYKDREALRKEIWEAT